MIMISVQIQNIIYGQLVNKIENEIQEQINTYIPEMNKLDYTINIELFQGTIRDILKVNIKIKESELNFILK